MNTSAAQKHAHFHSSKHAQTHPRSYACPLTCAPLPRTRLPCCLPTLQRARMNEIARTCVPACDRTSATWPPLQYAPLCNMPPWPPVRVAANACWHSHVHGCKHFEAGLYSRSQWPASPRRAPTSSDLSSCCWHESEIRFALGAALTSSLRANAPACFSPADLRPVFFRFA